MLIIEKSVDRHRVKSNKCLHEFRKSIPVLGNINSSFRKNHLVLNNNNSSHRQQQHWPLAAVKTIGDINNLFQYHIDNHHLLFSYSNSVIVKCGPVIGDNFNTHKYTKTLILMRIKYNLYYERLRRIIAFLLKYNNYCNNNNYTNLITKKRYNF